MKTYSSCPTYPQLYAKGELGGLNMVKDLKDNGELILPLKGHNKCKMWYPTSAGNSYSGIAYESIFRHG